MSETTNTYTTLQALIDAVDLVIRAKFRKVSNYKSEDIATISLPAIFAHAERMRSTKNTNRGISDLEVDAMVNVVFSGEHYRDILNKMDSLFTNARTFQKSKNHKVNSIDIDFDENIDSYVLRLDITLFIFTYNKF